MLEQINEVISGMIVPLMLALCGGFFSFRLNFFHILKPFTVLKGLRSSNGASGVSSTKAVTLALAGTLGVGNIVGVSSAIYMGGIGAVFWMWVSAIVAMILKYAEIVLAMRHRRISQDGETSGNAMNYILDFFASIKLRRLGSAVACIFAATFLFNAFSMGSMLQSNAISESLYGVLGIYPLFTGIGLSVITFLGVRKGTSGIIKITNVLVPLMSAGYIVISLAVISKNFSELGAAFALVFSSAFSPRAAVFGTGGFAFSKAMRYGVMRGLVSNEAGCGTAPSAHALASCSSPARQGLWGIFEVFIDTLLLCTLTALCVILEYSEAMKYAGNYMMMTVSAYSSVLGASASYFLCFAVACFGIATIICWAHYGCVCVSFFSPSATAKASFIFIYSACVFVGSLISPNTVWQLSDLAMGTMTVMNLFVITCMWKEVKAETDLLLKL